jgi:8-oxo-dGTP pyrophosphatase MutT (NUDIX family)
MRKQPPPCYAVGAVIYRYDNHGAIEVLLIKKHYGGWSLPKGTIKAGETELEALAREVAEETRLMGTIGAFLHEAVYTVVKRGQLRLKSVRYYLLGGVVGRPRPGGHEGIRKVRWFGLSAAIQRAHNDRVRTVLEYAGVALTRRNNVIEHRRLVERSIGG